MGTKQTQPYISIGETTSIKVTSRASVNIKNSYYTFEYSEEKSFPKNKDGLDFDIDKERNFMWQEANSEVDKQIVELEEFIRSKSN